MRRLLNLVKSLQIILHVMLIQVYLVYHTESFLETLQGIVFANLYGRNAISEMDDTDADQTTSSGLGLNTVAIFMIFAPLGILTFCLWSQYCPFNRVRVFCRKQKEKTLFNRLIFFFDGSLLLFLVSSTITIYRLQLEDTTQLLNFYCSLIFAFLTVPCVCLVARHLQLNYDHLEDQKHLDKVGAAYKDFRLQRPGYFTIGFLVLTYVRRIALAFVVILGRSSLTT